MSLHDYRVSRELVKRDMPFYALLMAAMDRADSGNQRLLVAAFPDVWDELVERYNAPGALLGSERDTEGF